jgi:adenine-specific DNA-methyltransferase
MPTTEKLRNKLLNKLAELFQLDQPDLDFGFYRIMKAKADQIRCFIDKDLLQIIEDSFGQVDEGRKIAAEAGIRTAIDQAIKYGAPDPENTPGVREARAVYNAVKEGATAEADVYDHLYRFFERYYDDGDFISRRYYARENSGKAAPFAIPYNGEEVKLHWANADQYYIKTTEYFSNYTFDITQAAEIRKMSDDEKKLNLVPDNPLKIHFRIVDATEDEHGNVKAAEDKKRFFVLYEEKPVELDNAGGLIVNFEYKSLPGGSNAVDEETKKQLKGLYGKDMKTEDIPNLYLARKIIEAVDALDKRSVFGHMMKLPSPTEKIPGRPLLAKYINQYTARNTMDYFIHKDLGGFLKRELDFYIKNEVMHLDDIENADAPAVETYLAKIKVIRKIAGKLIEFLAQLEDFQKKLWLKKKFVVETNYCITLDRVPEQMFPEIAANKAQVEEWVKLFAIDEIKKVDGELPGMGGPVFSNPPTIEFLKANNKLVLDTVFFSDDFKARLIESIEDFDEQCDGLLIHSENFQALSLLQERYREQVKFFYIDPPYNTEASPIMYKNEYRHSSWVSLIIDRINAALPLNNSKSLLCIAIDDYEYANLYSVLKSSSYKYLSTIVVRSKPQGRPTATGFSTNHEYAIFWGQVNSEIGRLSREGSKAERYPHEDAKGTFAWANFRKSGSDSNRTDRKKSYYPVYIQKDKIRIPEMEWNNVDEEWKVIEKLEKNEEAVWPVDGVGNQKVWTCSADRARNELSDIKIIIKADGGIELHKKYRPNQSGALPGTWWEKSDYSASENGTKLLKDLFNDKEFDFPKSMKLVSDNLKVGNLKQNEIVCDYFSGSGTTGHAIINLNREDNGYRKYILVEMGDYFDSVTKPRIAKVVYSSDWKDGKPVNRDTGASHCFKYVRLESYEDTLNNLEFDHNPVRDRVMEQNKQLYEDYTLHYLLDVETRGSQSLLNIDRFADPTDYRLKIKKPGSDEQVARTVDLVETFNYLIGLRLVHMAAPQRFTAAFVRRSDPELPQDQHTKLMVDGKIQLSSEGKWGFRKIEGWMPSDPMNPNSGLKEKVLIVWRNFTGDLEQDNLMLDEWFIKYRISARDFEYDIIYVNGSNNLPNLKKEGENWKVHLIEETFHKKMWENE